MSVSPFWRNPITDFTGCAINRQHYDRCAHLEMKVLECFEAYGLRRGEMKCVDLVEDLQECATHRKEFLRVEAMRQERWHKYKRGEISKEDYYAKAPKMHSY